MIFSYKHRVINFFLLLPAIYVQVKNLKTEE